MAIFSLCQYELACVLYTLDGGLFQLVFILQCGEGAIHILRHILYSGEKQ